MAWFRNRLVGADLADNSAPWQWVAGRGSDAATRVHVFAASLKAAAGPLAEAVA
jgi:deoxyribodipyrimidine photolyase